ncbi:uncharacterized protein LOC116921110 [Daphnia magna]|uniref:uncharacterized protein LOC116921110 n=1 Tax=Daphnia magna TaxID=35525 RepID=UPI001E1BAB39|nr:uncharacterized protein LOC116921110 [Daphnia magna]XP_045028659.1 uncharacterized protein LOC116921110 [Daphnia magna]XP_045028660.1 uncharacterized protein LOC116921110 [Daphnia magna]XP_045028661.1 uncharacterized protein LOC116921110 [Daphnia magna]XP_045028662.1 uncharacterized protein LOC116921110 [Daphnia magna]XP_045028663.1 uncharacterized protein LOC116921110 [Daphnia magna]XP_045028664.1 uncharacterized protein LOC116921110 [Daphnia magna]XP_045028665.1 uncharacterized protein 
MAVQIRKLHETSWCADWDVDLEQTGGSKQATFVFQRYPKCKPNFSLTCHYGKLKSTDSKPVSRSIILRLTRSDKQSEVETDVSDVSRKKAHNPIRYYETISVSIRINSGTWLKKETGLIHELTDTKESWSFKDARFQFNATSDGSLLKCEFCIKFATSSVIEMLAALERMTDCFFHQQTHCDVQFCFPNDEQPIGAHVKMLSSASSVFAAMFQHEMQESKTGHVLIQDTERNIFYQLILYIYSGQIRTSWTEGTAQKLLLAADKYNVTQLAKECTNYLISNIQWDRAVDLMIWANLYSIYQVKEAAIEVVVKNRKQICLLDAWKELAINYPLLCLETTRRILLA